MLETKPMLIVEDDPDIREVLQMILEGDGFTVLTAKNGLEALQELHEAKPYGLPFLVLLDLQMPVMSGQEFLKALRAEPAKELSQLSVVVLSAGKVELGNLKVQDRLSKPIDVEKLLEIVRSYQSNPPPVQGTNGGASGVLPGSGNRFSPSNLSSR
jgi:chemosensory pili system protein ChpA (sensor histidine kinase/response regulator)